MNLLFAVLNGKRIAYLPDTEFLVQVGDSKRNPYSTIHRIQGEPEKAWGIYNSIPTATGKKKRLLMLATHRETIAKEVA